jgi:CDP-glycerol glycerophosphotransferase
MKIDKSNFSHWLYLTLFGLVVLVSLCLRPFIYKKNEKKIIVLYGHKLNSNLKGIYDYWDSLNNSSTNIYFLTMDSVYFQELNSKGIKVLPTSKVFTSVILAKTTCIISDHGLHQLILLLKFTHIKFVDVWHGIPFKGFDDDDFKVQRKYDEVWVTSRLLKQLYTDKFGFIASIVHETGYARTDILINKGIDISAIKKSIGIKDINKKIILFAPTWQQDENNRNIFPFNASEESFLTAIDNLSEKLSAICVFRTHLNTASPIKNNYQNIKYAPHSAFPNTEEILLTANILICDWSSIAFDYLLLDRPTIFLDIPAPFKKGFSLNENYRFGEVIKDLDSMLFSLEQYIIAPETYWKKHGEKAQKTKKDLYDENADGKTSKRCFERLIAL